MIDGLGPSHCSISMLSGDAVQNFHIPGRDRGLAQTMDPPPLHTTAAALEKGISEHLLIGRIPHTDLLKDAKDLLLAEPQMAALYLTQARAVAPDAQSGGPPR